VQKLLDTMLEQFKTKGWLKARGKQRTDSTHILTAARTLNRLEGTSKNCIKDLSMRSS
jgi:transposase